MRKVIMATLALSPMLLHAQASTPVQAQAAPPSNLRAKLEFSADPTRTTSIAAPVRVSTGVIAPKLIHAVDVSTQGDFAWTVVPMRRIAVVNLIVDETGKPTNMKLAQSFGAAMDKNILEAVSQYRFRPGTVSHQPVPSPVNLEIDIRSNSY